MKRIIIVAALVSAVIGTTTAIVTNKLLNKNQNVEYFSAAQQKPNIRWANVTEDGKPVDFTYAAEQSIHAVVHVNTVYKMQQQQRMQMQGDDLFDFFFGNPFGGNGGGYNQQPQEGRGSGSGVIISPDGYIVTSNHVIDKANEIEVSLNNKKKYTAKVIGADPSTDIALLKIDAEGLEYLPFGNSDDLKVGEWVLAIGNPFNLTSTVTAGIVSAKARNLGIISANNSKTIGIESFIQTDAAINPGNSGGALVNTRGELIGINAAIATMTGSYSGYGFAVPSQLVQKVVNDIKQYGVVQRARLGIAMADLSPESAEKFNIKTDDYSGVIVGDVEAGSAAAEAGLRVNDIIKSINNVEVTSSSDVQEQIGRYRPNDKINIDVLRDGNLKHFTAVLRNNAGGVDIVKSNEDVNYLLGADFKELTEAQLQKYSVAYGVQITSLKRGKLQEAGIKEGFIITGIDRTPIRSIEDLKNAFSNAEGEAVMVKGIYPNGRRAYYGIALE